MSPEFDSTQIHLTVEQVIDALKASLEQEEDREMRIAIREAINRAQTNPSLLQGVSGAEFTFSDPLLAAAVYSLRVNLTGRKSTPHASAVPGEELSSNPQIWGRWVRIGLHLFLNPNDSSLQQLAAYTPEKTISYDKPIVRFAIVGDAGYKGIAQDTVFQMIASRHQHSAFDALIHLGDVYFAAGGEEMLHHFLGPVSRFRNAGLKVFTLLGNHDLYYGASAYRVALDILQQPGRYFGIESPHWRIACLDTALFDDTLGRYQGKLDDRQLNWLDKFLGNGQRHNALMSHHYYVSAWKPNGTPLRAQIAHLVKDRVTAWYWGHEHACATYERSDHGFYGACVGNGAFRERWHPPKHSRPGYPSWYAKGQCQCYHDDDHRYWPHGFLELELRPDSIVETYHLEDGPKSQHTRTLKVAPGAGEVRSHGQSFPGG
jgi:hypothetical protein